MYCPPLLPLLSGAYTLSFVYLTPIHFIVTSYALLYACVYAILESFRYMNLLYILYMNKYIHINFNLFFLISFVYFIREILTIVNLKFNFSTQLCANYLVQL